MEVKRRDSRGWSLALLVAGGFAVACAWFWPRWSAQPASVAPDDSARASSSAEAVDPIPIAAREERVADRLPNVESASRATSVLHDAPGFALCGRALDRETHAPIVDARITTGTLPDRDSEPRATSAVDGRFRVELAAGQRGTLCVDALGYGFALIPIVPDCNAVEREIVVELERAASLELTLLDAAGAAIADASVRLSAKHWAFLQGRGFDPSRMGDTGWYQLTDVAGRARFDELPAHVALTPLAKRNDAALSGSPAPIRLEPGESRALLWRVGAGAEIEVIAFEEDGSPAAGVALALERARSARAYLLHPATGEKRRSATTDERGIARFADVAVGDWAVGPLPGRESEPDAIAPLARVIAVSGSGSLRVELRLQHGLAIRGLVVAPGREVVRTAHVLAWDEAQDLSATCEADPGSGAFAVGPIVPGNYRLFASCASYASALPVVVEAGASDVVLRMRPSAAIVGRVLDAASGAPCSARVVVSSDDPMENVYFLDARDEGRFRARALAPGIHRVAAITADGRCGLSPPIRIDEGVDARGIEVEVLPGARVRLRFEGPEPSTNAQLRCGGALVDANGVERGDELFLTGLPGRATLRLQTRGGPEVLRELELAAGEVQELVYDGGWR